jgi:hypothetical protein
MKHIWFGLMRGCNDKPDQNAASKTRLWKPMWHQLEALQEWLNNWHENHQTAFGLMNTADFRLLLGWNLVSHPCWNTIFIFDFAGEYRRNHSANNIHSSMCGRTILTKLSIFKILYPVSLCEIKTIQTWVTNFLWKLSWFSQVSK